MHQLHQPFGTAHELAQPTAATNYLYTGQPRDGPTGLYDYGARLYDPAMRRFLAPDAAGHGFSPYAYCGNDPVNFVDPNGTWPSPLTASQLALVAGTALTVSLGDAIWQLVRSEGTPAQLIADFGINALLAPLPIALGYALMSSVHAERWKGYAVSPAWGAAPQWKIALWGVGASAPSWMALGLAGGIAGESFKHAVLNDSPYQDSGSAAAAGALYGLGFGAAQGIISQTLQLYRRHAGLSVHHAYVNSFRHDSVLPALGPSGQAEVSSSTARQYIRQVGQRSLLERGLVPALADAAAYTGAQAAFGGAHIGAAAIAGYYVARVAAGTVVGGLTGMAAQWLRPIDLGIVPATITDMGRAALRFFRLR